MIVDVHHHILPPPFVASCREEIVAFAGSDEVLDWTPERALEDLDRLGIDRAYTSLGVPGVPTAPVARACNEYAAELAREHPGRFGTFATLPLPSVSESLAEIEYACDVLGVDGFGLLTTYGERRIGDPLFAPVFEELDRRGAVIHLHPTAPAPCRGLIPGFGEPFLEFPFDTTRAVASLIYGNILPRLSNLRLILSHGGGPLAILARRLAAPAAMRGGVPDVPAALRLLYTDVVTVTDPIPFDAVSRQFGSDHLLLGTDYPYVPPPMTLDGLAALGLDEPVGAGVAGGSALQLLGRGSR